MSFIISCIDEKIEVNINNENVQKSKLLIGFYEEYKEGSELDIPFNMIMINYLIKGIFKIDNIKFEKVYNFLNYLIVDNEIMVEYLSYKLYKIDFEDAKYYIENTIDKSFLKAIEQKEGIINCAEKNDLVGVFIAIKSGTDINIQNKYGKTALHYASRYGHVEIVRVLLNSGADISAKNKWGRTALHNASCRSYVEVAKVLLEYGANVNSKDEDGDTALHDASRWGYIKVVKVLLEYGSDVNMQNKHGNTALHDASANGYIEIVKLLKNIL